MGGVPVLIDRRQPLPQQVVVDIRGRVARGELAPGDPLPATRALARELGISRGSVVTAYEQLVAEGFLTATHGGTRVNPELPRPVPQRRARASGTPAPSQASELRPGAPVTGVLTTGLWRAVWRAAAADPRPHPASGSAELRELLATHIRRTRQVDVDPARILVTAGARDGLRLALSVLGGRGGASGAGVLAVEEPGYPSLTGIPRALGWRTVPIDTTAFRDASASPSLPAGTQAVLVTPNHQFPWGERMPAGQRLSLLAAARRAGAMIVEDDYDAELRSAPAPLLSLDSGEQVIMLGSFAKTLSPAVGLGYLVAPEEAVARMRPLCVPVSGIVQDAMTRFLAQDGLRRHVARARRIERQRRALFTEVFPEGVPMEGGLHAVVLLAPHADEAGAVDACHRAGLGVSGISAYWVSPRASAGPGVVLGLGARTPEHLRELLVRLREVLTPFGLRPRSGRAARD
ncbi:PLP-dependent aminotransferase family protein [Actinomyces sp. 594]|nr:PLP-dependent aminotransferase family protein [Actinomyces sp. 594]